MMNVFTLAFVAVALRKGIFKYDKAKALEPLVCIVLGTGVSTALSILEFRNILKEKGTQFFELSTSMCNRLISL